MKISIINNKGVDGIDMPYIDLIPESQAEVFQLQAIDKAIEEANILGISIYQWSIQSLRIFLINKDVYARSNK